MFKTMTGHSLNYLADTVQICRKRIFFKIPFTNWFIDFNETDASLRKRIMYYARFSEHKPIYWFVKLLLFFKTYRFCGLYKWDRDK